MGIRGIGRFAARCAKLVAREGFRGVLERLHDATRNAGEVDYNAWAKAKSQLVERRRKNNLRDAARLAWKPCFGIWIYLRDPQEDALRDAIDSIIAQHYPHWVLCIVEGRADMGARALVAQCAARESRIRRDSDAVNVDFVSLLEQDGSIESDALFEMAKRINADRSLDMLYSDEDQIDPGGVRFEPFFKPNWSPEYLESCMYTAQFAVYRKTIADRICGFGPEANGARDYDFVLKFTEQTDRIAHVPQVLYHRRAVPGSSATSTQQKSYVVAAGARALQDRLERTGRQGRVQPSEFAGCFKLRSVLPRQPLVSIVIPTAGGDRVVRGTPTTLVIRCVERIRTASTYSNYEIVVVDNGDLRPGVRRTLDRWDCRFITFPEPEFNISKKVNLGASIARGEYLLLLNDDTEIISQDWIEAMLEQGLKPGVGVVGAKLLYEDGSIQHAGVAHHRGLPAHVRKHFPGNDPGYHFSTISVRNYLAVTGACMLTPRAAFSNVGGYDEAYKVNFSDIDYCLKLRERGLRAVYTPHAELYHYESASRRAEVSEKEEALFLKRWKNVTKRDAYYNGDVLQTSPPDFSLRLKK